MNVLVAAAGLPNATSSHTLVVSTAGNFAIDSGGGLGGISASQFPAIVTDPMPVLHSRDANATVDVLFASIDDLFEPVAPI